ncbi:MAG: 4a-hydroxytetrahydrobiopterin dehydratase [Planctomycetes bacterium]|nr:4a-hydroxytetrahydrobiopterin dehydratase [Planctomycetota bacterium]
MAGGQDNQNSLSNRSCGACRGDAEPLKGEAINAFTEQLSQGWQVIEQHHLEKEFKFKNFKEALDFVNRVGDIAESQEHHPDIHLSWGKVKLAVFTHKISGLHENDFIFAAKVDELLE